MEARGLHHEKACSSPFSYCVERLGFSEEVAYKHVAAARREFPLALELLAQGRLDLTALTLIRPHLTELNHREWLLAACGKTKREVALLVAPRCLRPDIPQVEPLSVSASARKRASPVAHLLETTRKGPSSCVTLADNDDATPTASTPRSSTNHNQ